MKNLAIIGTAGRGDDFQKLTLSHWVTMREVAQRVIVDTGTTCLVSGGAAWADHVAVSIALEKTIPLALFLPGLSQDKETALKYHRRFQYMIHQATIEQIKVARGIFGNISVERGSFKDRNLMVAAFSDMFLAFTFGNGERLKDGGTAHTVKEMMRQGKAGWHFNLNDLTLYPLIP